jgi:hypothetical protein
MQFPLDYPECCIHGRIRRGTTLGYMEALADEQELNAYSLTPSLLHKGDTHLTDVVIGCVEVLQSLGNPSHQMRGQRHVLGLNV